MTFAPTSFRIALACGVGGAFVDVSALVFSDQGVSRSWGRSSQFDDLRPGQWSFVLDNADGRFTPGNSNSSLAVPLREGMRAVWELDGRLVGGVVRSADLLFSDSLAASSRVRIVVHDLLGEMARTVLLRDWRASIVGVASPVGYYPFDDAVGGIGAADQSGFDRGTYTFKSSAGGVAFEQPGAEHDRARFTGDGESRLYGLGEKVVPAGRYFSFWIELNALTGTFGISVSGLPCSFTSGRFQINGVQAALLPEVGVEYFIEVDTVALTMKIDGALAATASSAGSAPAGDPVKIQWGDVSPTDVYVSDFALTNSPVRGELLQAARRGGGAGAWVALLEYVSGKDMQIPALSAARIVHSADEAAVLTVFNDVLKAEQGAAYVETTGTFAAPVDTVVVYGRDRPSDASVTFSTVADIDGSPEFRSSTEGTLSSVDVASEKTRVTVTDESLVSVVGFASGSERVPLHHARDLRLWGQDRLLRGTPRGIEVVSFTVDARLTSANRWADLFALRPGHRVRLSGLPLTQLGFDVWDGWLLGVDEQHTPDADRFTVHLAPTLPRPALFSVDAFVDSGELTLGAALSSSATTMTVSTTGAKVALSSQFVVQVDSEQMLVTSATSATPQIVTVSRGLNGTTAVAHSSGAAVRYAVFDGEGLLFPAIDLFPSTSLYSVRGLPSDISVFAF